MLLPLLLEQYGGTGLGQRYITLQQRARDVGAAGGSSGGGLSGNDDDGLAWRSVRPLSGEAVMAAAAEVDR